jgi:hypothetical protein
MAVVKRSGLSKPVAGFVTGSTNLYRSNQPEFRVLAVSERRDDTTSQGFQKRLSGFTTYSGELSGFKPDRNSISEIPQ